MQQVLVVASFKSEKMDWLFIYFGHHERPNHSHLLGAGPAPLKFLHPQTSISWQPGVASLWRNAVVMGNCDHGERNKLCEPLGDLSVSTMKAGSKLVLLWKPEQSLAVGQRSSLKASGLFHQPLHGLGVFEDSPGRHAPPHLTLFSSSISAACDIPSKTSVRRRSPGWLGGTLPTLGHVSLLLCSCASDSDIVNICFGVETSCCTPLRITRS